MTSTLAAKEHSTALLKRKPGATGVHKATNLVTISTGGVDRQAAQLAKRRPGLADAGRSDCYLSAMKLADVNASPAQLPRLSETIYAPWRC